MRRVEEITIDHELSITSYLFQIEAITKSNGNKTEGGEYVGCLHFRENTIIATHADDGLVMIRYTYQ